MVQMVERSDSNGPTLGLNLSKLKIKRKDWRKYIASFVEKGKNVHFFLFNLGHILHSFSYQDL